MAAISSGLFLLYLSYLLFLLYVQSATSFQLDLMLQQPISVRDTFLVIPNRTHILVSAFVDDRPEGYGPAIRILGYAHFDDLNTVYCKIYYTNGNTLCLQYPAVVEVIGHSNHDKQTVINAYLCRITKEELAWGIPNAVSLLQTPGCEYSEKALRIQHVDRQHPTFKKFGVCVPEAAYKADSSPQDWVEFLEMCRILGADFVQVYNTSHTWPLLSKLPQSYLKSKDLHLVNWTLKDTYPSGILSERTLLVNDCLYRNLNRAKQLVVVDSNELLIPHKQKDWSEMLLQLHSLHNSSFVGAYLFKTIPYYDESTGNTSSYSVSIPHSGGTDHRRIYRLPQIVTHRLRTRSAVSVGEHAQLMVAPRKVTSISKNGIAMMLPGFLYYSVPIDFADVHRFTPRGKLSINDLKVDASTDKYVPHLLNALHQKFYSTSGK